MGDLATGRDGHPVIIRHADGALGVTPLPKSTLPAGATESWLQELLDKAPSLLPIDELDDRVEGPLTSLGREILTPVGPLDNLFVSRNGYVVIVETKLFRNPEARRRVVAQILDYATHVRRWTYSDLNELSQKREPSSQSLFARVSSETLDEARWIDSVNANLASGRVSLLIVGDGISTETQELASSLEGHAGFPFRLALMQLRLFALGMNETLVVPTTLLKVTEVERAVVTIRDERADRSVGPSVSLEPPRQSPKAGKHRSVLSEDAFLFELSEYDHGAEYVRIARKLLDLIALPLETRWSPAGASLKVRDPNGSGQMFSLATIFVDNDALSVPNLLRDQLLRAGRDSNLAQAVAAALLTLLKRFGAKPSSGGIEHRFDILALAGKEAVFVDGLLEIARLIGANEAPEL